jgi:hypothetical protein
MSRFDEQVVEFGDGALFESDAERGDGKANAGGWRLATATRAVPVCSRTTRLSRSSETGVANPSSM